MYSIFNIFVFFIFFINYSFTLNVYPKFLNNNIITHNSILLKHNNRSFNFISREKFISNVALLSAFSFYDLKNNKPFSFINNVNKNTRKNILIIGCGHAGIEIIKHLKLFYPNIYITVTTTKPKRLTFLKTIADNVILIPQLATHNNDQELINAIHFSNTIIVSDIISIFSPHSFLRTAIRIRHNIDSLKKTWNGNIIMISSENAYGSVLNGDTLQETSIIYPNINNINNNNNSTLWHVNPYGLASIIRSAEQIISNGPQKTIIFRTAGIWDTERFTNAVLYTKNKEFPSYIKNSFISFTTTVCISKAIVWCLNKKNFIHGIFNLADFNNKRLTRQSFYSKLYDLYSFDINNKIIWNDTLPFNFDTLYSMDPDPYAPCSQRSNSILSCNKIYKLGFKK